MNGLSNRLVSIIIVAAGNKDYLKSLLDSILQQSYSEWEIIVIDNSLNPNFNQEINQDYPTIKLYTSPINLFYCQALNKGIEMAKGDFILCLNDDVILGQDFLREALRGFAVGVKVGMVSGKILRSDKTTIDSTGLFLTRWRTAKERGYGQKDTGQFERAGYIFGVNGAVAFYRRQMLEDVKLEMDYFDADYRMFYEDLDIAWRAQNLGWQAYYVPQAAAYHVRGGTARGKLGMDKPYARRYISDSLHLDLLKNRYLTIIKNEHGLRFFLYLPFMFLYDAFVWGYILSFHPRLIRDFFSHLEYFKSAWRKRRLIAAFSRRRMKI